MHQSSKTAVVWGQPNCPGCKKALHILKTLDYSVEYRELGSGWDKKDLIYAVPDARSVPQIFVNDLYVGGLTGLEYYLSNKQ
jgi:glutaredoxin